MDIKTQLKTVTLRGRPVTITFLNGKRITMKVIRFDGRRYFYSSDGGTFDQLMIKRIEPEEVINDKLG